MIRTEHFASRYKNHKASITFSIKRLTEIKMQIKNILTLNPDLTIMDFDFLIDIASLVLAARRSLCNTYPFRYYLSGENK